MLLHPLPPEQAAALRPRNGGLWVVRWIRTDGRNAKHRYFRRRADARVFAARLRSLGKPVRVYLTETKWLETAE